MVAEADPDDRLAVSRAVCPFALRVMRVLSSVTPVGALRTATSQTASRPFAVRA